MPTHKLVNLLDTHKYEISLSAAHKVVALKLKGYANLSAEQLAPHFVKPLEFVSHYIETGQLAQWQAYISKGTIFWVSQGWPSREMSQTARCIIEAIGKMLEQTLPGESRQKEREGYLQRFNSILMLTSSIIVSTKLENGLKEPS